MDDIPFVIDNSVTAIIYSHLILFTGPVVPTSVTLKTAEDLTNTTKLVVSVKLILTDDANNHHSYVVPRCVCDQNNPVNILGVPALGNSLVILKIQLIFLQRMVPPSNMVLQNHTLFVIIAGTSGIVCTALA